jgi:hypothetical protein
MILEEIDGDQTARLRSEEFAPRRPQALVGWAQVAAAEDLADRGRRHRQAESVELADNPLIAPARILPRQPRRTSSRVSGLIGGRPTRRGYVQRRVTSHRCQRKSVAGVTMNAVQRSRGSSRLKAAKKARSALVNGGRATRRRNTTSSWRSTMISNSFDSLERNRSRMTCRTLRSTV